MKNHPSRAAPAAVHPRPRRRHRAAHHPASWQLRLLYGSGGALLASGLVWLAIHYTIGAGADQLPHPAEAWSLRLHGLALLALLFAFGSLVSQHVAQSWAMTRAPSRRSQRISGLLLCALLALLALTGYLLYYFAPEDWRPALGWAHAGLGLVAAAVLAQHHRWSARPNLRSGGAD